MRAVSSTTPIQHDGKPLSPDDYFSVAPDPSIGPVISSQSNKTRSGFKSMIGGEWGAMIGLSICAFIFGGIAGAVIVDVGLRQLFARGIYQLMEHRSLLMVVFGLGGAIVPTAVVILAVWMLRKERLTWVGAQGLMRWEKGVLGTKSEVFRFADARSLTVQRTRHYVNGAYSGTNYNYTWWGPGSAKAFVIAGQYAEPEAGVLPRKPPAAHDQIYFATAAERGWSRYRITQIDHELKASGQAAFGTTAGVIRIGRGAQRGQGWIQFEQGGKTDRLERNQIESVSLLQGALTIKRVGAKEGWFSSEGVFRFSVAGMADFAVFAAIFEEELGLRLG
jgi:hypothetical protein